MPNAYSFCVIEAFLFYVVCIKEPGSDFFYTCFGDVSESFFRYTDNLYVYQVSGKTWIGYFLRVLAGRCKQIGFKN